MVCCAAVPRGKASSVLLRLAGYGFFFFNRLPLLLLFEKARPFGSAVKQQHYFVFTAADHLAFAIQSGSEVDFTAP